MYLWLVDRSRMSREGHVRICEGVGVRFPHATRRRKVLKRKNSRPLDNSQIKGALDSGIEES